MDTLYSANGKSGAQACTHLLISPHYAHPRQAGGRQASGFFFKLAQPVFWLSPGGALMPHDLCKAGFTHPESSSLMIKSKSALLES